MFKGKEAYRTVYAATSILNGLYHYTDRKLFNNSVSFSELVNQLLKLQPFNFLG